MSGIGRVFVYRKTELLGEIKSPCSDDECRFGFAISNLGDIDKDGKEDFAVGAPGSNAIYVYYGRNIIEGNFNKFQKIELGGLKGFGYSISKEVVDVDGNEFNDAAVGAPFSNSAVLLKSRPVIRFDDTEPIVVNDPDPVDPQSGQFNITLEIKLDNLFNTTQEPIYARIQAKLDKSDDNRVKVETKEKIGNLNSRNSYKTEVNFKFTSSNNFNVTENDAEEPKPIGLQRKFELSHNG